MTEVVSIGYSASIISYINDVVGVAVCSDETGAELPTALSVPTGASV